MSNDTQPLTEEQVPVPGYQDEQGDWHYLPAPVVYEEALRRANATEHTHGPFAFLLNQNHNALRGCTSCGATWVGVMAGPEDEIRWHVVAEPPEEE